MRRNRGSMIALAFAALAWTTFAGAAAPTVEPSRLRYDVAFLAADSLEGRRSGSVGASVAARFIADRFAALGLVAQGDGSFLQPFTFISGVKPGPGNALRLGLPGGPREAKVEEDFRPLAFSASGAATGEVVFAGYGIRAKELGYDDYANLDVKGKIVLVLRFSPDGDDPASRFQPFMPLRRKAAEARDLGAATVLVATGPVGAKETAPVRISFDSSFADSGLPVLGVSTPLAEALFAGQGFTLAELQQRIDERKEPASRPLGVEAAVVADVVQERSATANVLALLPGRDPARRDEVVVVGAHYDHLGYGGEGSGSLAPETRAIHNGADDNASGSAGLLETARLLAASPPARSVLLAAFSGEEEGLLGSQHLVQNLPVPKERVVAMLNLDMIGRPKGGKDLTVGGTGTATEWPVLLDAVNANHHLKLSTSKGGFGASDHSSFYGVDIPVLFFFTGAHEDYHRPSDDTATLDFRGMARVVQFVADTARSVAEDELRPTFQRVVDEGIGERRAFKVRTGVIPEYAFEGPGVKLSGVRGGSPADRAGIKGGDVVIRFGARETRNIYDYMYALGDHQPGETVPVTVRRGSETLTLEVTLEAGGSGGR